MNDKLHVFARAQLGCLDPAQPASLALPSMSAPLLTWLIIASQQPAAITTNRAWEVLEAPDPTLRRAFAAAGKALGKWTLDIAGLSIDGARLTALAAQAPDEPFIRVVREALGQPLDLEDFLLMVDDLLRAKVRGHDVHVPSGRARAAGILLHPDDVFTSTPRRYGDQNGTLHIDRPKPPQAYPPAAEGEVLGPRWTARFPNPESENDMLVALASARPQSTFAARVQSLREQLQSQGAKVYLHSSVRSRSRGYLMWGAFLLSKQSNKKDVSNTVALLDDRNKAWGLNVAIGWRHPQGWRATVEAARIMKDTYDVVYATERGARESDHYDGVAVDLVAIALPRELVLQAPDGTRSMFDLSGADEPRDLSLTPIVIDWIEQHFAMKKLRSDYPHWSDTTPAGAVPVTP